MPCIRSLPILPACLSCQSVCLSLSCIPLSVLLIAMINAKTRGAWIASIASIVYTHTYRCGLVWSGVSVSVSRRQRTHERRQDRENGLHCMGCVGCCLGQSHNGYLSVTAVDRRAGVLHCTIVQRNNQRHPDAQTRRESQRQRQRQRDKENLIAATTTHTQDSTQPQDRQTRRQTGRHADRQTGKGEAPRKGGRVGGQEHQPHQKHTYEKERMCCVCVCVCVVCVCVCVCIAIPSLPPPSLSPDSARTVPTYR